MNWHNPAKILRKQYKCGHCGKEVGSDLGYFAADDLNPSHQHLFEYLYICPFCTKPSLIGARQSQIPGIAVGNSVSHVEPNVNILYEEARRSSSANCFTGTVLLCRKLLMNIAVAHGAKEGLPFIEYIDYLAQQGFVPPNGKGWVDHIRKKGNEATHEIVAMAQADAEDLLHFSEMLLKFIYEFPARIPSPTQPTTKK